MKQEATRLAGANLLQQQAKFNDFIKEFNNERPHEALEMKCPGEFYAAPPSQAVGVKEVKSGIWLVSFMDY